MITSLKKDGKGGTPKLDRRKKIINPLKKKFHDNIDWLKITTRFKVDKKNKYEIKKIIGDTIACKNIIKIPPLNLKKNKLLIELTKILICPILIYATAAF